MEQQTLTEKILAMPMGMIENIFEWWEHSVKNDAERVEWKVILCHRYYGIDKDYTSLNDAEIVQIYLKEHPQDTKEEVSLSVSVEDAALNSFNKSDLSTWNVKFRNAMVNEFKNGSKWQKEQPKALEDNSKKEYKYVWLNMNTGEFSNSWGEKTNQSLNKDGLLSAHAKETDKMWKLIKYQCLTDDNFEFYNQMQLK